MKAAVITVSDRVSRGEAEDRSGPAAVRILEGLGFSTELALVVTTGGTGFGPRDLTPEATGRVIDKAAPGLVEAMRSSTFGINPHGMLSRAVAGIAGSTLVVNLPGSVAGVEESLAVIGPALVHAVELLSAEPSDHRSAPTNASG